MGNEIQQAAEILRRGGLVAFPTETVYGLGADARRSDAVLKIFAAKGRPATNPLIVHVAGAQAARRYVLDWPERAQRLTERFWPGPLTLVLPKSPEIVDEATAGRDTVGLRCPDHPLALALLREFDGPVAAPSANRSTRISPTTAQHVRRQFGPEVELILDGGPCRVGIESTVLDLTSLAPRLLRPGGVALEEIRQVVGEVEAAVHITSQHVAATSPGQHARHYCPTTPTFAFDASQRPALAAWCRGHPTEAAVILALGELQAGQALALAASPAHRVVPMPLEAPAYARRLYQALHAADAAGASVIWIERPPQSPQWLAVNDRLRRAASPMPAS